MISAVIEFEDGRIHYHTSKAKNVNTEFQPGWYEAYMDSQGNLSIKTEKLNEIHEPYYSKENELITNTVDAFFKKGIKESVEKMGFTHKLGILMYGKQGTGKSSIMNSVSKRMIDNNDSIVIYCNSYSTFEGGICLAKKVRENQDNPIIFIADEFDIYVHDMESHLKNLLDGKDSIPNSLFLAATNYIERIPNTLKDRPSRFKLVLEIFGIDDKLVMTDIMRNISNQLNPTLYSNEELEDLFDDVDSITIDEIKQMALDKLTDNVIPKQGRRKIGFISDNDNGKHRSIPGRFRPEEPIPSIQLKKKEKKEYNSNI